MTNGAASTQTIREEYEAAKRLDSASLPSTTDDRFENLSDWWDATVQHPTPNIDAVNAKYGEAAVISAMNSAID